MAGNDDDACEFSVSSTVSSTTSIHLDANAESCSVSDAGCTDLISSETPLNLIQNQVLNWTKIIIRF